MGIWVERTRSKAVAGGWDEVAAGGPGEAADCGVEEQLGNEMD